MYNPVKNQNKNVIMACLHRYYTTTHHKTVQYNLNTVSTVTSK